MSRIISYPYDNSIKAKDAWVGTDEASRKTKQYTAEALAEYLNISGSISIIGQMTYKYGTTPLNGIGTLAVFGGGPDIVAFSAVVKLTLSNQDISNQRVVEFLDLLVGSDILIAEQGAISTFGYYSIGSYAINATDSNYYDLGVTFKSGNGSMRSDRIYEAQNFVLANDATQSPWNTVPDGISYTAANVGIGTTSPSEKLEVSGGIKGDALFLSDGGDYVAKLLNSNITANHTFTFPDNDGTLAITSDIPSASQWDDVTGGINYANGNVGIGTTSPTRELDVIGQIQASDRVISNQLQARSSFGMVFKNSSGSDLMLMSNDGKLGIGTTSPNKKLHVNSGTINEAARFESTDVGAFIEFKDSGTTDLPIIGAVGNNFDIRTGGSTSVRVTSAGNVGIGTDSPNNKLDVNGNISIAITSGSSASNQISMVGSRAIFGYDGSINSAFMRSSDTSKPLVFGSGASEFMRIVSSTGNVGIGTTNPLTKLEIISAANEEGIAIKDSSGNLKYKVRQFGGNSYSTFWDSTNTEKVRITSGGSSFFNGGNVGIGTISPSEKLHVTGRAIITDRLGIGSAFTPQKTLHLKNTAPVFRFEDSDIANSYLDIIKSSRNLKFNLDAAGSVGGSNISFSIGSTEVLRMKNGGNVGIGTTSPSQKLQVVSDSIIMADFTTTSTKGGIKISEADEGGFLSTEANRICLGSAIGVSNNNLTYHMGTNYLGIGTASPGSKLEVAGGDIEVDDSSSGLILKSPDGTRYRITVANGGTLTVTAV